MRRRPVRLSLRFAIPGKSSLLRSLAKKCKHFFGFVHFATSRLVDFAGQNLRREFESQLAHTKIKSPSFDGHFILVRPVRLELTTSCLKGKRSNQLSYGLASGKYTIFRCNLSMFMTLIGQLWRFSQKQIEYCNR